MRFIGRAAAWAGNLNRGRRDNLLRLAIFLAVLAVAATAVLLQQNITFTQAGYAGVALTALVAGVAEGVGELTGYFLGYSGHTIMGRRRFYQRLEAWMGRRGWLVLFLVSLVPNPVFDVVGVAAGALRYPIWRFLVVVWAGKIIKFGAIAYACTLGIDWFLENF